MQDISLSEEVLSKLRALGRNNGLTEDQILRRLLGCPPSNDSVAAPAGEHDEPRGFVDTTYGIVFPEGFEVFRTYKGRRYAARVVQGRWRLDGGDGGACDSLNQLSQAVIDGNENAWMFWYFKAPDGTRKRIAELRDPNRVQKRPRKRSPHPEGAVIPETATQSPMPPSTPTDCGGKPWEPQT